MFKAVSFLSVVLDYLYQNLMESLLNKPILGLVNQNLWGQVLESAFSKPLSDSDLSHFTASALRILTT